MKFFNFFFEKKTNFRNYSEIFAISSKDLFSASIPKKKPTIPPTNIRPAALETIKKKSIKVISTNDISNKNAKSAIFADQNPENCGCKGPSNSFSYREKYC